MLLFLPLGRFLRVKLFLIAAFLLLGLGLATVFGFSSQGFGGSSPEEDRLHVAVTLPTLAWFVKEVGGDRVHVTVLIPAGANPHTYEPRPSQLLELRRAKVYVEAGSGLEFEKVWLGKILELNRHMLVVDCSRGLKLVGGDPHIWLSPRNAVRMVENIYLGLAEADPGNASYYAKNREKLVKRLVELDERLAEKLSKAESRFFMAYHPAWGYFARDYGLVQIAIEREGKEPSLKDLAQLIEEAREKGVKVILASPEFNPKMAEVVAGETGCRLVFVSPLTTNYEEDLLRVAEEIAGGKSHG